MEEAYMEDINESIKNDIYSLWLNSYNQTDTDEFKIFDLSNKFKVATKKVVEIVKNELKTEYLKSISTNELKRIYSTLKIHEESSANKLQMEIIKSALNDRNK